MWPHNLCFTQLSHDILLVKFQVDIQILFPKILAKHFQFINRAYRPLLENRKDLQRTPQRPLLISTLQLFIINLID